MARLIGFNRRTTAALVAAMSPGAVALANGSAENILLIIDPTNPVSLHIGNHYKQARNIPDSNVLYMRVAANNYTDFKAIIQPAFADTLTQRGIGPLIDYVVLAPTDVYFIPAPNLIVDQCSPVNRFSITSCFAMSQFSSTIVAGTPVEATNMYFSASDSAGSFDASVGYLNGTQNASGSARRFYVSSLLGYTGQQGSTAAELVSVINRSVAVDGTRPVGTFYYMNNAGDAARNVRQPGYAAAATAINSRGGAGQQLAGILPTDRINVQGVMTGNATLNIPGANMTILPGAFCDHLTSFAATFEDFSQTKLTAWITAGASGSSGAVEEPCNYTGKFPSPKFHIWYFQGMSLGAAHLRSLQFLPFQHLLYGDPMTRPYARLPTVSVVNPPAAPVRGTVSLQTTSAATFPSATVSALELLVDGVSRGSIVPSVTNTFTLDTSNLNDGWHDVRVLARDSSALRNVGRWTGSIIVDRYGRKPVLEASASTGNLATAFVFTPADAGIAAAPVRRVHLLQNGRIIAARPDLGPMTVFGTNLGAGAASVSVEIEYADNRVARSAPITVQIENSGTPGSSLPQAFSFTKTLVGATAHVVELPGVFADAQSSAQYFLQSLPGQATILNNSGSAGFKIVRPNSGATGQDTFRYSVTTPGGTSAQGTVTIRYAALQTCAADFNADGTLNGDDLGDYINSYFSPSPNHLVDTNADGGVDADDLGDYINLFFAGCA